MRHLSLSLCAGLIFALVLPASATQAAGLRHQVTEDAQPAPSTLLPPARRKTASSSRKPTPIVVADGVKEVSPPRPISF
jgi:hypothetical protein